MKTIEAETTQDTALAVVPNNDQALGRPLSLDELHRNLEFVRDVMRKEMQEGQDYGKIPGCGDKPTLLQPGAQKLLLTFNLCERIKKEDVKDYPGLHREYAFVITVTARNGKEWDGVGTCSTMDSKYRYRNAARKCPQCGKEAIIKGKQEYGGGWLCYKKKGGCGAKWPDGAKEIESQSEERVEHDNPVDYWNTVRKMAFKRALVHAAINATNTSELWSQDLEDAGNGDTGSAREEYIESEPSKTQQKTTPPLQKATPPMQKTEPATAKQATQKTKEWMIKALEPVKYFAEAYFIDRKVLAVGQTLADLPLEYVPTTKSGLDALAGKIREFSEQPTEEEPDAKPQEQDEHGDRTDEAWRSFSMPWGKQKGVALGKLDKKYLFGLAMNQKDGLLWPPEFKEALNAAATHYGFDKPREAT